MVEEVVRHHEPRGASRPAAVVAEPRARQEFGSFLRSVGMLAGSRQLAALAFVGVVLALPNLGRPSAVEEFLWAYYGSLIMTSVAGLGFERSAMLAVAKNGGDARRAVLPLIVLRVVTIPMEAVSLWIVLRFVGVTLPAPTFLATIAWIIGIQLQLPAFSAFRAVGRRAIEPTIWITMRAIEAPLLLVLASGGAQSGVLVGVVAAVECAGGLIATSSLPGRWSLSSWHPSALEIHWRTLSAFALIELVSIAYLRADLLLVGRILGPTVGAAYGLLSRIVDGILGVQNSISVWMFADTARRSAAGDDPVASPIRHRSLALFPRAAALFSLGAILLAPQLGHLVPSLAPTIDTLRLLLAALPLFVLAAIETYGRSAAGGQRKVLVVVGIGLVVNVMLNIVLLQTLGLVGAGWALLGSECVQVLLLYATAHRAERAMLSRTVRDTLIVSALLLVVAGALNLSSAVAAGLAAAVVVVTVVVTLRPGSRSLELAL